MATQADYKLAMQYILDRHPGFLDQVNTILAYVDALNSQNVVVSDGTDDALAVTGS